MNAPTLVLLQDEGPTHIAPTATTPNHQDSGNAGYPTDPVDKVISMLLPSQRSAAEGYSHDTIPSFASSPTSPSFVPVATESPAFPEPASVDDFLFELDQGIEPSLEPPLSDDTSSTTAISLRDRFSVPFSRSTPTFSDASSTIAPSFTSFTSSLRKKVASIASAGAFFNECLDSKPYRTFSVRTFCESLFNSRRAANARIVSLQRYGDLQGVPHRFLIMRVTRADGREFYLRLDRRRDHQVPLLLFGVRDLGTSRAIDTAAVSGRLDHLLDFTNSKSSVEAVMVFPTPAPLIPAAHILYAIAAESPDYKLTKENCWFFASTIQEMLMRMFGAKYDKGVLNHPTISPERRNPIKFLTYPHIAKDINDKSETMLRFARLIADPKLAKAVKSVLHAVKHHHESAYQNFSPPNASQVSSSTQGLLAALQQALHEHLHACCGIQRARVFRTNFSDELVRTLPSLELLQEDETVTHLSTLTRLLASPLQSDYAVPRHSLDTYDSFKHDIGAFPKPFPGLVRGAVLSALELVGQCKRLDDLPTIWRLQMNRNIPNLQSEFRKIMTTQLKFACCHWNTLLCELDSQDNEIMNALSSAVQVLLHWIAAMGIMGEIDQACRGLRKLERWLRFDAKAVNSICHVVRSLRHLVERSRDALAASSLSILGRSHPFVPSGSALGATFPTMCAVECHISSHEMDSSQPWSPPAGIIHSPSELCSVVFSPDGCHIVSACMNGMVHIWDAATRALLRELKGHTRSARSVTYSPDGIHLALASNNSTVHIWDAVTGVCLRELKGHTDTVNFVTFSPDGLCLASASCDRTVRLWDTATGELLRELEDHDFPVWSVSFSPDGRYLASDGKNVRIWDASTGALLQTLEEHAYSVYLVKFSPDGCCLASALSNTIHVWNVATGIPLQELKGGVKPLDFSPDGHHLASASIDHTLLIWDVATGVPLRELKGHTGQVQSVNFSLDGCCLASASGDGTLRVWDVTMEAPPRGPKATKGHVDTISCVKFSPDGCHLVSGSKDGRVCAWDIANRSCIEQRQLDEDFHPHKMLFSTDALTLRIQGQQETKNFSFPKLSHVSNPISTSFCEFSPSHLFLDHNALCIKHENIALHICWLPDYFKPSCPITEHGNHVGIGGEGGMIAFINIDGLVPPDLDLTQPVVVAHGVCNTQC